MTLKAEIQKRQQAVSDLKRQVEQITALAGDDKKAGIRVADALRFNQKTTRAIGAFFLNRSQQRKRRRAQVSVPSVASCSNLAALIATGPNAEQILANIKYQLERNQALADDYPEICDPILALDGTAQRGATQTANGKRTFLKWAQDYIVLPTVRVPDHWDQRLRPGQLSLGSGAVITTRGLDSAIRGVLVGTYVLANLNRRQQRKRRRRTAACSACFAHSRLAPGKISRDIPSVSLRTLKLMINPSGMSSSFM